MKNANNNVKTAVSKKAVTIADPESKATSHQLRCIGHAVKTGNYRRFSEEAWKRLTKGEAAAIIDEIRSKIGEPPASRYQKKRFVELVNEGFLRGVKKETFRNLTAAQISRMIYKGMKNKEAGIRPVSSSPETPAAA